MSEAACAKEILCDNEVNKAQAFANAFDYLQAQTSKNYGGDPDRLIVIKKELSAAMKPHLLEAEKAGAEVLNKYIE